MARKKIKVSIAKITSIDDKGRGVVVATGSASFTIEGALPYDTVSISMPFSRRKK